ncbi:MAG: tetratricopeptide repeat protein [Vampirovibrionales bacterium]
MNVPFASRFKVVFLSMGLMGLMGFSAVPLVYAQDGSSPSLELGGGQAGQFQRWMQDAQAPNASLEEKGKAMYGLARSYETGSGVELDVLQAVTWYQKALALPIPAYQQVVLYQTVKGRKVRVMKKQPVAPPAWYAESALHLATLYIQGKGVVTPRVEEAFHLLQLASKAPLPAAWFLQGLAYMEGQGTQMNLPQGFAWVRRAAESGYPAAVYKLAMCYAEGLGTAPNLQQAYVWSMVATALNVEGAQEMSEALSSHLSEGERVQAQVWIRAWVKRLRIFES